MSAFFTSNYSKGFSLLLLLFLCSTHATENLDEQKKLQQVQQQIAQQQSKIAQGNKQRQTLLAALKKDDLAIANIAKKRNITRKKIKQGEHKLTQLQQQKKQLTTKIQQQQNALAAQIRSQYANGQHDYLKLILNQQKPVDVQRALEYYQYLAKARMASIDSFKQNITALQQVVSNIEQQQTALTQLATTQKQQSKQLKQQKQQRKKSLAALNQNLQTEQQKLAALKAQEQNLVAALEQLANAAQAEFDLTGLASLKHKLEWPTKGRLLKRFGRRKQGYLRWKGVLISGNIGQEVKAIQNGKVLFSDWLNGYGLVTVVDHGDGYMSLYGHNQTLLKAVGDRVETGEPIALVGQSGGQNTPGLYFEIRHKGKALNPSIWCN